MATALANGHREIPKCFSRVIGNNVFNCKHSPAFHDEADLIEETHKKTLVCLVEKD